MILKIRNRIILIVNLCSFTSLQTVVDTRQAIRHWTAIMAAFPSVFEERIRQMEETKNQRVFLLQVVVPYISTLAIYPFDAVSITYIERFLV